VQHRCSHQELTKLPEQCSVLFHQQYLDQDRRSGVGPIRGAVCRVRVRRAPATGLAMRGGLGGTEPAHVQLSRALRDCRIVLGVIGDGLCRSRCPESRRVDFRWRHVV
jgi:hypothetical protein